MHTCTFDGGFGFDQLLDGFYGHPGFSSMSGFAARLSVQRYHLPPNLLGVADFPGEGQPDGTGPGRCGRRHLKAVAIDSGNDRGRGVSGLGEGSAEGNHRLRVVGVHVPDDVLSIARDGIRCGTEPVGGLYPRHPAIAADVTQRLHLQPPQVEVLEVDVVGSVGVGAEEGFPCRVEIGSLLQDLCLSGDRDPAASQRVSRAVFDHQQRRTGVGVQVPRVLGQLADQKDGTPGGEAKRDKGTVGVPVHVMSQSAQCPGAGCFDQGAGPLGVGWCPHVRIVEEGLPPGGPRVLSGAHGC